MPFIVCFFIRIHLSVRRPHGCADILIAADDMHACGERKPFNGGSPVMELLPFRCGCFLIHSFREDHIFSARRIRPVPESRVRKNPGAAAFQMIQYSTIAMLKKKTKKDGHGIRRI